MTSGSSPTCCSCAAPTDVRRLLDALTAAWQRSDALFALLPPGAWTERPIALRQPFVFYLGHLPAFGCNQLLRGVLGEPGVRADFELLFERGIDPLDAADVPAEPPWPPLAEIVAYRDEVRRRLLDAAPRVSARARQDELAAGGAIYHVVLEHELMHHETLLYMLAERRWDALPAGVEPPVTGAGVPGLPVTVPGGQTEIGGHRDRQPFGWDNEFPAQRVEVDDFRIDSHPVTNARLLRFVRAGGYREEAHWTPADRAWRDAAQLELPHRWRAEGDEYFVRTPFGELPFAAVEGWPAQLSQAEAAAFASWAGGRLPTEAELQHAAYGTPDGSPREQPWGSGRPTARRCNAGFVHWSPVPVGSTPAGESAFGVHELVGNGWEHTSTVFAPLPGFEAWVRTYPGYSADFFDGEHNVVFGASWATDLRFLRRSFRNWYQRHYPYVFSKFRVVY